MFVHTVIMVIEPHMKQGRQHKLISTIFLATSVTKKLAHNKVLFFIFIQDKWFVSSESIPLIDTALFGGQTGVLFSLFFTNILIDMLRINVFDPGIQGI